MNYYDAIQIRERAARLQPVDREALAEANSYVARTRGQPLPSVEKPHVYIPAAPTMGTPCICGQRYGMHRVKDFACPNPKWYPGNGQPNWLTQTYTRGKG